MRFASHFYYQLFTLKSKAQATEMLQYTHSKVDTVDAVHQKCGVESSENVRLMRVDVFNLFIRLGGENSSPNDS